MRYVVRVRQCDLVTRYCSACASQSHSQTLSEIVICTIQGGDMEMINSWSGNETITNQMV